MSTPLTDSQIHRAKVVASDSSTGEIKAMIPSVTGLGGTVPITMWGREIHAANSKWLVPAVGDTIVVCREDEDYTNVFWINTTVPPDPPYTFVDGDSGTLHVDMVTNRIGINNTSPLYSLDVTGKAKITDDTLVGGDLSVTGGLSAPIITSILTRLDALESDSHSH